MLNEDDDYFVLLVTPAEVRDVAAVLPKVTKAWLRERYDTLEFPGYEGKSDEDFEYIWANFEGLPAFFARVAEAGKHVVFTVDQ